MFSAQNKTLGTILLILGIFSESFTTDNVYSGFIHGALFSLGFVLIIFSKQLFKKGSGNT